MFQVVQKLKAVKEALKSQNVTTFGKIDERINVLKDELYEIQTILAKDQGNEQAAIDETRKLYELINAMLDAEEFLMRQKSQVLWLKNGDRKTRNELPYPKDFAFH